MAPAEAPQRPTDDPRNLPAADPLPPGGDSEGATGAPTMIVPAETIVQLIGGPTAPRSGMMSHDRRGVPPTAPPPPLEVATVPPPGGTTALPRHAQHRPPEGAPWAARRR